MIDKTKLKKIPNSLKKYSGSDLAALTAVLEEVNPSIVGDMFDGKSYSSWARMYKKSKLPFHQMSHKRVFVDGEHSGIFSGRNAFIFGMEMPIEDIPKYLHTPVSELKAIVEWRLKVGK